MRFINTTANTDRRADRLDRTYVAGMDRIGAHRPLGLRLHTRAAAQMQPTVYQGAKMRFKPSPRCAVLALEPSCSVAQGSSPGCWRLERPCGSLVSASIG